MLLTVDVGALEVICVVAAATTTRMALGAVADAPQVPRTRTTTNRLVHHHEVVLAAAWARALYAVVNFRGNQARKGGHSCCFRPFSVQ